VPRPASAGHVLHHLHRPLLRGLAEVLVDAKWGPGLVITARYRARIHQALGSGGCSRRSGGAGAPLQPRPAESRPGSRWGGGPPEGDPVCPASDRQPAAGSVWVRKPGAGWRLAWAGAGCLAVADQRRPLAWRPGWAPRNASSQQRSWSVGGLRRAGPRRRPRFNETILNPSSSAGGAGPVSHKGCYVGQAPGQARGPYDGVKTAQDAGFWVGPTRLRRWQGLALRTEPSFTTQTANGPADHLPASGCRPVADQPACWIGLALVRRQALGAERLLWAKPSQASQFNRKSLGDISLQPVQRPTGWVPVSAPPLDP